jgi:hypothetical protein
MAFILRTGEVVSNLLEIHYALRGPPDGWLDKEEVSVAPDASHSLSVDYTLFIKDCLRID